MSVSNAFTAAGFGTGIIVPAGQSVTFEVSGTFTGQCFLERIVGGVSVIEIAQTIADTALAQATYANLSPFSQLLRWRSTVATGTATAVVDEVTGESLLKPTDVINPIDGALLIGFRDDGVNIPNLVGAGRTEGVGSKDGATVTVAESGQGAVHQTVLTLTVTPIALTDDADVGQWGTLRLYGFPAGNILVLGAVIDAILTLDDTEWTDAAEGDLALGSSPSTDASALATVLADILASTAIAAMTAQVGPIDAQSLVTGAPLAGAGGTDDDLNLNVLIDDAVAHITGTGSITGTVTITWVNLGDF